MMMMAIYGYDDDNGPVPWKAVLLIFASLYFCFIISSYNIHEIWK